MTITQEEIDIATKLMKSALLGGVVFDANGEMCFDGDEVRINFADNKVVAKLIYDTKYLCWRFDVGGFKLSSCSFQFEKVGE